MKSLKLLEKPLIIGLKATVYEISPGTNKTLPFSLYPQ